MVDTLTRPLVLVVLCAIGYTIATFAMKSASSTPLPGTLALIALALALAVVAEVALLRQKPLGVAYLTILAGETAAVLLLSLRLGETLSPGQIAGGVLVMGGLALLSLAPD